ncbi:MAG: hypothetical protein JWP38_582 [Herbaspirillum sp.]|nr:hypothetical protein [Herbaspirillum sp.]
MSNALREKLLRFEQLRDEEGTPESKAIVEALFLQTSIINERLFNIEQALRGVPAGKKETDL